ncbi:MAG: molybdopterin-dependent oxidoreductase [Chloroflexi bacterium]|nr:molybdopterin-dependent oxidoreductase [Chloroflexota bacterium]
MKQRMTRREWLKWSALAGAGLVAAACGPLNGEGDSGANTNPSGQSGASSSTGANDAADQRGSENPETIGLGNSVKYTRNEDFYVVDIGAGHPAVDEASWRLTLDGGVEKPLKLSLAELKQLPSVTQTRTFECISNPVGGPLIGNALWVGVQMKQLLAMAGMKPGAKELVVRAADGFHTSIPIELAMHEHALLAYMMNGEPLPRAHGFPLRCVWPGRYGMKQPRWITRIEVIDSNYRGFWEQQGWSNDAFIKINSQILAPKSREVIATPTYTVRGLAHAGLAGVKKVAVSADDGKTWNEATLIRGPEPKPLVWTEWRYEWPVPADGRYTLIARATDNNDGQQEGIGDTLLGGTFPDGTSRMHAVTAIVKRA